MHMALMTRMARLFRADLHAVLDRIEEPEVLLRQALREMEECVNADRRELAVLMGQQRSLAARGGDLERAVAEIGAQLDVCFEAADDDLARTLLRRRLEVQRQLAAAARRRGALDAQREALARRLQEHESRLRALREQSDLLAAEEARHAVAPACAPATAAITEHDVEIALLREKQLRSRS
jgi:phage shock protein A